jgi:IS5 family transposase
VTGGEAHEVKGYDALMELHDINPDKLLGDKGYDSDDIRDDLAERGIEPVIPPRSNRKTPIEYDRQAYRRRNLIERCVNRQAVPPHRNPLRENRQSLSFDAMYRGSKTLDQNCQHGLVAQSIDPRCFRY